jgi:hypothetical protein
MRGSQSIRKNGKPGLSERKRRVWGGDMQQPHEREVTVYADIAEVRMEVRAVTCNQLLAEGWVLLGIYLLTTVAEMTPGDAGGEQRKQIQDTQRYVRRLVGYVVGRRCKQP